MGHFGSFSSSQGAIVNIHGCMCEGRERGKEKERKWRDPRKFIEGMREDIVKLGCDGFWSDSLQGWETDMEQEDSETISHC